MADRKYLSNISKAWPRERQLEVLAGCAADPKAPVYEDVLSRRGLMSSDPELLEDRKQLLQPTSRRSAETIWVAALPVLARSAPDLLDVFAKAAVRHATIIAVAEGVTVPPDPHSAALAEAVRAWDRSRKRAMTEGGRKAGILVSAERRRAITAAGLEKVRADWGKPSAEASTASLIERSGLTYKSLNEHLGPRKKAQRAHLLREQRATKRAALNADE